MTREEELSVIKRVIGGDRNAYEALVLDNQKNVYNLALKMTGNESDALDISQDVFIRAFTTLGSFRGDSRFGVWLYRLTHNACIDLARAKKRASIVPLTYETDDGEENEIEQPDDRWAPEETLEKAETRRAVRRAMDELSEEHRQVLTMREFSGLSYDEISDTLGITVGTVKSRIARARIHLAKILTEDGTFSVSKRQLNRKGNE